MCITTPSSSRNKFVYGRECVICRKYDLVCKRKGETVRSYPQQITLLEAADKIKESAKMKESYSDLYLDKDLIATEFKCHHECRIDLIRKEKETSVQIGNPIGDLLKVTTHIDKYVLEMNQVLSMNVAVRLYLYSSDEEVLHKTLEKRKECLKQKLQDHYNGKILILSTRPGADAVIINASNLEKQITVNACQEECINTAAKYIRRDIEEYCERLSENPLNWPPSIEELMSSSRIPPPSVTLFLTNLLKPTKHNVTSKIRRLVESYTSDLIYGVSGGQVMTPKHYLLGLCLHNMTGQKKIVQMANRLGHSITYDKILDIETAQARKAQMIINSREHSILPIIHASPSDSVSTVFWVDNFDKNLDTECGGGAINMTTMMAFQEMSEGSVQADVEINVEKCRNRTLGPAFAETRVTINNKQEPSHLPFKSSVAVQDDTVKQSFQLRYFAWLFLRYSSNHGQRFANFPAFLLNLRTKKAVIDKRTISKTIETYLPPLETKVAEANTISTYMKYLQQLSREVNMKYVNITLDIGAAMNAYKLLWGNMQQFSNIVLHVGDFHYMKENFKVLGKLVRSSGFEDVIFQSGVCTSGSLEGVLGGSHYNRAWRVHQPMLEALERLLYQRFLDEEKPKMAKEVKDFSSAEDDFIHCERFGILTQLAKQYEHFKDKFHDGHLGKTAKFWIMYMDLMQLQHQVHIAVQENDFNLRLQALKRLLPYYFYFNFQNYARYISYYVEVLERIDELYPELNSTLLSTGLSIQAQDRYPLRTVIDQTGEQTINRNAKTSDGGSFANSSSSILNGV